METVTGVQGKHCGRRHPFLFRWSPASMTEIGSVSATGLPVVTAVPVS
jgi:hypothetical protein